ncbi:unnamed protein product [Nyctereutes procyonoides]|uniref:(raccoon dog) hypothetical protein n=1 Tax=Nyctereutes procyonoides TaxID=34880 RepID=A0A811ZTM5_NYCPR|nr:unnamed protein product [Nyctereutes procyonoides]
MLLLCLGTEGISLCFGMPLGISVDLTFPSAMMSSYCLLFILLFFCGSELLIEVLTLVVFSRIDRI